MLKTNPAEAGLLIGSRGSREFVSCRATNEFLAVHDNEFKIPVTVSVFVTRFSGIGDFLGTSVRTFVHLSHNRCVSPFLSE
jgi:hypothetical protein